MRSLSISLCLVLCLQLFLLLSLSHSFALPSCHTDQSSALLHFKSSFSTRKPNPSSLAFYICDNYDTISYPKTSAWKNGTNCCLWDGIACNPLGQVISLNLNCSWLHGKLLPNSTLFHLTHLQMLDLSYNDFQGSHISSNFSQLASLTDLSLKFSGFSGKVPSQISHLHKLVSLHLWEVYLSLEPNAWERLLRNATHINDLGLNGVDMSSIPLSLLLMNLSSSLVSLTLWRARLHGNIEDKVFSFPKLQDIHLGYNINLTGYLPRSNCSNSLRYLRLYQTSFIGELPHCIGHMKSLNLLDLSYGQFKGELPRSFWNLTQLTQLYLSHNNFSGQISSSLSNLQNLNSLDLSSNNFGGQFPYSLSKLKNLEYLSLSNNGFYGHLPSLCFTMQSLKFLSLSSNQFTGQMGEISSYSLEYLDVSNNKLLGSIPRTLFSLENLTILNLSHNFLLGGIQMHHFSWKSMYSFDLSFNSLQGELSSSICNATSLEILNLSHNKFTGSIPHCIGSSSLVLSVLDFQKNNFLGRVPKSFEVDNNLRTLNFNGNLLEGSLPRSLVHCSKLEFLDLGRNFIEDIFPYWLQDLKKLQILVLRQNKFHGSIPNLNNKGNHAFIKLRVFDVSNNNLGGPLPPAYFKSFGAMKSLEGGIGLEYMNYQNSSHGIIYQDSIEVTLKGFDIFIERIFTLFTSIDLSNNMFEGEIPQVIGELSELKGLNFAHNWLNGSIPSSIGNLRKLESLDFSSNKLIGKIPPELASLDSLGYLNLSLNELEGCIPMIPHFETFSNDSFKGNKDLRGFQLDIPCITHEKSQLPLPRSSSDVGFFEFGWKPILLGYICGASFGASMFWVVIFSGKPHWFASMVNDLLKKWRTRINKHCT